MAIRKHLTKANAWIIDWYPDGRKGLRRKQIAYDVTESEARLIEQSFRRQRSGGIRNVANPQLRSVFPEWLEWMRMHRSPKTVESIGWALKHLLPHFGDITVPQLNETIFNRYKKKRSSTPRSCNLELDYLKSMISWMVERKMCVPLPFKIERLPYSRPVPRIPTPEDFALWMASVTNDGPWEKVNKRNLPGPKKALLWIMVRAGLRFKEVTHLRWEDIDFRRGLLYYKAKGAKQRISILPDEAKEILQPILEQLTKDNNDQPPKGWIAPSPKTGAPYGNMKNLFKTASEKSCIYIKGPHHLRHICGTFTLAATGNLRTVQATLGHTQIRTTEWYTQVDIEALRLAQQKTTDYTSPGNNKKK